MCLSCLPCLSQHTDAKCLFSLSACALSPSILLCVRASCISSVTVYLFVRPFTSFQSCFGLVFSVILLSVCCQLFFCGSFMSPSICVLRRCILAILYGVGVCNWRCLRVSIFYLDAWCKRGVYNVFCFLWVRIADKRLLSFY